MRGRSMGPGSSDGGRHSPGSADFPAAGPGVRAGNERSLVYATAGMWTFVRATGVSPPCGLPLHFPGRSTEGRNLE